MTGQPADPLVEHPAAAPGIVRRTTSLDAVVAGEDTLRLIGQGRDAVVGPDGAVEELDTALVEADVDVTGRQVVAIRASTGDRTADISTMVGTPLGGGFRRALAERVTDVDPGSLLALLLDELPGGGIIAGVALLEQGVARSDSRHRGRVPVDVCAGWAEGGTMAIAVRNGEAAYRGPGRAAAAPEAAGPRHWHDVAPLSPGAVRRRRRVDVRVADDGSLRIDSWFRDAFAEADGTERVIHEYTVLATVAPEAGAITGIVAEPRVLPAEECPSAAASASRLVGQRLVHVRDQVRASFSGPSTCTHLNDALRALGDVWALIAQLEAARSRYSSRSQRL